MNTSNHPSASVADLSIKRRGGFAAATAEPTESLNRNSGVQHQIAEDLAHLRDREENLRAYEVRLRAMQVEIDAAREQFRATGRVTSTPFAAPSSRNPFDDGSLQAAWDKLHRARTLLETEQTHMREDRLVLNEERSALKRREEMLSLREARFVASQKVVVAAPAEVPVEDESTAMGRLTRAPFAMAKSVFSSKR